MTFFFRWSLRTAAFLVAAGAAFAPAASLLSPELHAQSLDLGFDRTGLSIGNSPVWNGVRVNWSDREVREVNGLSLTLWRPHEGSERTPGNPDYVMRGIALGVVGPEARIIRGFGLGLGGVRVHESATGLTIGGLGAVSGGDMSGLSLGGLGVVADRHLTGIQLGGLGVVSQADMTGIQFGGLGLVAERHLSGLQIAGLGSVSQGSMKGFSLAGLGAVAQGDLSGVQLAGLGLVSEGHMSGIQLAGLGVVSQGGLTGVTLVGLGAVSEGEMRWINLAGAGLVGSGGITGVNVGGLGIVGIESVRGLSASLGAVESRGSIRGATLGGYRIRAPEVEGVAASVAMLRTERLRGFSVAAYNEVKGAQVGVTIGIFNSADELRGLQLGVLNRAKNNSAPFRWLPLVNAHF